MIWHEQHQTTPVSLQMGSVVWKAVSTAGPFSSACWVQLHIGTCTEASHRASLHVSVWPFTFSYNIVAHVRHTALAWSSRHTCRYEAAVVAENICAVYDKCRWSALLSDCCLRLASDCHFSYSFQGYNQDQLWSVDSFSTVNWCCILFSAVVNMGSASWGLCVSLLFPRSCDCACAAYMLHRCKAWCNVALVVLSCYSIVQLYCAQRTITC